MADQDQPQVGVVGQPQQQGQQQQVQRGIPGAPQPPVPSQAEIQRVLAEQQRRQQADMAEAQRRAAELAKNAKDGQTAQFLTLDPAQRQTPPQQPAPSPIPGMTAEQVLAGYPQQAQQPGNQFAKFAEPKPVKKTVVPWYPMRSKGINVELTDSIIQFVPEDGVAAEGNAQAKVVLALFAEILALREKVAILEQSPGQADPQLAQRVYNLERTLFEQRQGMKTRALAVKDQILMFQEKGMSAEDIVAALAEQSQKAADMVDDQ